jgi:hypothetical protein
MKPPVELQRLISAAIHDGALAARLRESPDATYAEFHVPQWQQDALRGDPATALGVIGVHPNLQFKFLGQLGLLKLSSQTSVQPFLNSLEEPHGAYR